MGQFPSRPKRYAKHSFTADTTPSSSSTTAPEGTTEADTSQTSARHARTIKQSRRSTLRRSITDLVSHSFLSKESRENKELALSGRDLTHSTTRKRCSPWRTSKRWSRALTTRATQEQCPISAMDSTADTRLGKERETESSVDDIPSSSSTQTQPQPQTLLSASPNVLPDSLSEPIATDLSESRPSADITSEVEQLFPSTPEQPFEPESLPTIQTIQDIPVDESPLTPPPAPFHSDEPLPSAPQRHFPPQGTLVVVQGVVNTTDTGSNSNNNNNTASSPTSMQTPPSRPSSSLLPTSSRGSRSPTPTGDMNTNRNSSRLSTMIRRPTSIFSDNRRASGILDDENTTDISSSVTEPTTDFAIPATTDLLHPGESTSGATVESDNDAHLQQRPLSPGSIDVLGTLLSVAAAATAASLFSPNSFPRNNDSSPEQDSNRPTSPTPTAGLGVNGFGPLDTLAGLGFPMERDPQSPQTGVDVEPGSEGQNVSRDRLRGAWDSLRDRLGLHNAARPSGNSAEPQSADGGREDGSRGTGSGTGETMINEMARALGTGLGLQEDGSLRHPGRQYRAPHDVGGGSPDSSVSGAAASDTQIPAEGSFERFLFNLQTDLRAVLSEDGSAADSTTTDHLSPPAAENSTTEASSTPINRNEVDEGGPSPGINAREEDQHNEESLIFEGAGQDTEGDSVTLSPALESPIGTPITPNHGRRVGGGINLWRSYRFPPIVAPSRPSPIHQPGGAIPDTPTPPFAPPPVHIGGYSPPRPESESSSEATISGGSEPILASPPTTPGLDVPALDIVVPVIIVGLQSVNIDHRGDQHDDHENILTRPDPTTDEVEPEGSSIEDRPNTPRGRPWHSRAASALRNLRPGRRPGMAVSGPNEPNASRTFLIYVIGGYYPPNHHIVTGTDGMDSYEALWELAALLGQVKPPVATPEDIENSGLQIIKPEDIDQYANDGKVASNCIDRCLICLDDYEPEDDLRVMSCKHFFHKSCVDKWLQIGRNNCPACRTKGVSTNNETDPSSPAVPHTPAI